MQILYFLARRILAAAPLILVVASISFFMVQLTPGSPAGAILGNAASPEAITQVEKKLGLDRPVAEQYFGYISSLARGDLGRSWITGEPVVTQMAERLPVTIGLALVATLVATASGLLLGTAAAVGRSNIDRTIMVLSGVGLAVPSFWIGALLVLVFALELRWLPATGHVFLWADPVEWARHLALPVAALSVGLIASVTRQTRAALLAEFSQDYVRSLLGAGVPRRSVIWRHALRNASIPVVTSLGVQFVGLLGGAVVIEYYFALPGIGALVVAAAQAHDLPVVQGVVVVSAFVVLAVNLVLEFAVALLNPKARQ